jgi:zinc D-Ala-D-Ala carboxypeptidase
VRPMICPRCWGAKVQPQQSIASRMLRVREPCGACDGAGAVDDEQLSPHFRLSEFIRSEAAVRLRLPNEPSAEQIAKLRDLAAALERVREIVGVPLRITSGFRCLALNRAIGSEDTSAHPDCGAVDLDAVGIDERDAAERIADSDLAFDQVLLEPWLHFGLRRPRTGEQRRMAGAYMPAASGKRVFVPFKRVA